MSKLQIYHTRSLLKKSAERDPPGSKQKGCHTASESQLRRSLKAPEVDASGAQVRQWRMRARVTLTAVFRTTWALVDNGS